MDKWLLICHDEEFDFDGALRSGAFITWPQFAELHPGDEVFFYDPGSENLVFRGTVEQSYLPTMDPESTGFVRSVSFYDGAARYIRLRPTDRQRKVIKRDLLMSNGINTAYSSRLTPDQAVILGGQGAAGQQAGGWTNGAAGQSGAASQYSTYTGMGQGAAPPPNPPKAGNKKWIIIASVAGTLLAVFAFIFFGYHVYDPPTCEEPSVCKICRKEMAPATGHNWDSGYYVKEPTCTEDGTKRYTCLNDGSHVKDETVPALGHDWAPATYSKPSTCRRCGETTGDRKGIRKDVGFSDEKMSQIYIGSLHVTPMKFSEKIKNCREMKLSFQVDTSAKIFATDWEIYLRCNGSWIYKGGVKLRNGKKKSKVVTIDPPASVDAVYVIPSKRPNKTYSWNTRYWVEYVQAGE